jgi:hypothetical protein
MSRAPACRLTIVAILLQKRRQLRGQLRTLVEAESDVEVAGFLVVFT